MLTKIAFLASVGQAVVTPGLIAGSSFAPVNYILAVTPSTGGSSKDYAANGYACVRRNWVYGYPMTVTTAGQIAVPSATQSPDILAFYPTVLTQLGTKNTGADGGAAGENSGCFASIDTTAAVTIATGTNAVTPNRLLWKSGANYVADVFTTGPLLMISVDFVLASMYQDSFTGTGTRGTPPNNYCDQ